MPVGLTYQMNNFVVNFSDSSSGATQYYWDFGDSTYSTYPDPVHIYNDPGVYHVCLNVTNSCGSDTTCENISILLPLALHITITSAATNDLLAQFNDLTIGTTFWKWKFGDGDS